MSTLDQIRANLKAGKPHVVTSLATPWVKGVTPTSTSSSKADPLAALRAQVKTGKYKGAPAPAQTTADGMLFTAIAIANGHNDPNAWALKAVNALAGLNKTAPPPSSSASISPKVTP
jgi:hypothetical protein